MEMPGRKYNPQGYRYGFNGKENDRSGEWGLGLVQDYGARIYSPGLGRWLSVDPLEATYPDLSPYVGMNNNPVYYIDPDGASGIASIDTKTKTITITSRFYVYGSGASKETADQFAAETQKMWNDANGTVILKENGADVKYKVQFVITAQVVTEKAAGDQALKNDHVGDYSVNFLRIEDNDDITATNGPYKGGSNTIKMSKNQVMGKNHVSPHEYGHSIGYSTHPGGTNSFGYRVTGQPGIFCTMQQQVDAEYTVNPERSSIPFLIGYDNNGDKYAVNGLSAAYDDKGTLHQMINPLDQSKRKVLQSDIDLIIGPIRQKLAQAITAGSGGTPQSQPVGKISNTLFVPGNENKEYKPK
jgi:RHS repeat-associated protein